MKSVKKSIKIQPILSLGMQGQVWKALPYTRGLRPKILTKAEAQFRSAFLSRFDQKIPKIYRCGHEFLNQLASVYQEYWLEVLLNQRKLKPAERLLFRNVANLCRYHGFKFKADFEDEYYCKRLKDIVETHGVYCIIGKVVPVQELEIWKTQEVCTYKVELPESTQKVRTTFLKQFAVKGWMDFATLGVFYPGGWAQKDGLFCNSQAYNRASEKFRFSYLAHEAQHYSDYKRFPKLEQIDLEYRAKLAELSLVKRRCRSLLRSFSRMAAKNKNSPHAFANFCVLREIMTNTTGEFDIDRIEDQIALIGPSEVNVAAKELLKNHSRLLKKRGAKTVKSFIR